MVDRPFDGTISLAGCPEVDLVGEPWEVPCDHPKKRPLTTALLLLGPGGARLVTRMITLPLMLKLAYSPLKLASVCVASTMFVAGSMTSNRSSRGGVP
jgi:hypothetical protein